MLLNKLREYYKDFCCDRTFIKIRKETDEICKFKNVKKNVKVLFGMSFSQYKPSQIHDFLLSQALKLRGAQIYPVSCGALQYGECNNFGGCWCEHKDDSTHKKYECKKCIYSDEKLWSVWANEELYFLNGYIDKRDEAEIIEKLQEYSIENYKQWEFEGIPVGKLAVDALVNNEMVGDEKIVKDYKGKLKKYLHNIFLMFYAWENILKKISPDVIIANDSFYYQWAILEAVAKKHNIPFYSQWSGGRKGAWCYAYNDAAMNLDMKKVWKTWINKDLDEFDQTVVESFLAERHTGKTMTLNTAKPENTNEKNNDLIKAMISRPMVLLTPNVIWDLAALNKQIQFSDMIDWIINCIEFFNGKSNWNLVIKIHPAEEHSYIPMTVQKVQDELEKKNIIFSDNIFIIPAKSTISVYELYKHAKIGLVYTTTAGLEMVSLKIPVLTAGRSPYWNKGFTYDTNTPQTYFSLLTEIMENGVPVSKLRKDMHLAKKFFYLYYFRYYASVDLFDYSFSDEPILRIKSAKDLDRHKNVVLDYICDSMLQGFPIMDENRWIPKKELEGNIYKFNTLDFQLGEKIKIKGYETYKKENNKIEENMLRYEINNEIYYEPKDFFKPGELMYLYNEVTADINENPHAYETAFLKIEKNDIVLDIGACEGFFIKYALKKDAGKVYAFECLKPLKYSLEKTYFKEIKMGRVKIVDKAISDKNEILKLNTNVKHMCEVQIDLNGNEHCQSTTIDLFAKGENIEKIDFIKMDIEGSEMNALLGMENVIKEFHPKLSIAVYHKYENAKKVKDIIKSIDPEYTVCFSGCYMWEKPYRPFMVYAFMD